MTINKLIDRRFNKKHGNYKSREELTAAIHKYTKNLSVTDTAKNVGVSRTTCLRILQGDEPTYSPETEPETQELASNIFARYWAIPTHLKKEK